MRQDAKQPRRKLVLGAVSLSVGFVAATFALFNWIERTGLSYLLANYARYVCAFGGFGAMIFGAMLVNDFLVRREFLKQKCFESKLETLVDVEEKKTSQPIVTRKPRKRVSKTARRT